MHVVVTAGHVDHGKSTLVKALTGTDPDRLAEERIRGMTIDLGFAWTDLGEDHGRPGRAGVVVAFVDVPGHHRLVRNVCCGSHAVAATLLVVAATEGWKPQSEEHLRILELTGIEHGTVALTKVAGLSPARRAEAAAEVREHLRGTFLAGAPLLEVDAPSGEGLIELRSVLSEMCGRLPPPAEVGRGRLWVDRSFLMNGAGTVVTGTMTGTEVRPGDTMLLAGRGPGQAARATVRRVESLGRPVEAARPGSRAALNLRIRAHARPRRGQVLLTEGAFHMTSVFDGELTVVPGLGHRVTARGAYLAYLGSGEHQARLTFLGSERSVEPGGRAAVRVGIETALPLVVGDRYILRETGRGETIGGGVILDVAPVLRPSRARPTGKVVDLLAERGPVEVDELWRQTGARLRADTPGGLVYDPVALLRAKRELVARVDAAGDAGLETAALSERERDLAAVTGELEVDGGRVRRGGAVSLGSHPYLTRLRATPFSPLRPAGVEPAELRALLRAGLVVSEEGRYFAASVLADATEIVTGLLERSPAGVTLAAVRDALGSSRNDALALCRRLDALGVTRRVGDVRVAGYKTPSEHPSRSSQPGTPHAEALSARPGVDQTGEPW